MIILKECPYSNFSLRGLFFTVILGIYTIHYKEYCMYLHYSLLVWELVGKSLKNVLLHSLPCYVTRVIVFLPQVRSFLASTYHFLLYIYLRSYYYTGNFKICVHFFLLRHSPQYCTRVITSICWIFNTLLDFT